MTKAWRWAELALWALFGLLLPITSFPPVVRLSGADMVSPASGLVLLVLIAVSVLPRWWHGGRIPKASLPLLAFFSAVLVSCGLAFLLPIPLFREQTVLKSETKALITLAIGVAFYLSTATWAEDEGRAAHLLRWINWGGLLTVGWTIAQAGSWQLWHTYPAWMQSIHALISTRELFPARATGLAFEPSWLAHQLNMLYLPFWAGAVLCGTTVHRFRWRFVTVELVLLMGGLLALIFSVSRVGLLAPILSVLMLTGFATWWTARRLQSRIMSTSRATGSRRGLVGALAWLVIWFGFLAISVGMFLGAAYGLSRFDPRMRTIFDLDALRTGSFASYANQLVFAERVIFWEAGWQVFNDYPVLGVGLGNAGFFFPEKLSAYSWGLTEVRTILYQWDSLPNSKSLWVRLLAEAGIIGFGFFMSWLYVIAVSAVSLFRRKGLRGAVGIAGLFVLAGMLTEGFSVDTFALPYFWVSFALITAVATRAAESDSPSVPILAHSEGQ
jgi:O-antigen ligase